MIDAISYFNMGLPVIDNNDIDNVSFYSAMFTAMLKGASDIRQTPDTSWHLTKYTQYDKVSSRIMNM